ncbi:MAG TPA: type II toxin-antitoxin system HicB family antitoxin [archaeon]|nr:type II toxin-antitoxin system HicB family antitoxin [archaeon]
MRKAEILEIKDRRILVFVYRGEKYFIAEYPFLDVATQGRTEEEALHNIKEAVEIHLRERHGEIELPESEHIASVSISLKV